MNVKTQVGPQRYKPLAERPGWEHLDEYVMPDGTLLKSGVTIHVRERKGKHAVEYVFMYAERNTETGAVTLAFVGGRQGHKLDRFFRPEQIKVLK